MPHHVQPVRYRIHITPDMDRFRFDGRVNLHATADTPIRELPLNANELAVWQCRVKQSGQWRVCRFNSAPDKETLTIVFPEPVKGDIDLDIEFQGRINDRMAGFYRSRFEKNGQIRYIAVTQFQESDARRAFPCMDHPLHKAVFELTMTVPDHLTVLANTLPSSEKTVEGRLKEICFAPTPKMSTYLLFFGVGAFDIITDNQDNRIRVAHLPGLAHTTGLGLEFGRQALQYCEDYYNITYPLSKMDLIAVPDFAFGAMENWGAITFRENLLLNFPDLTSRAGVQRICEVIAHEIAHQWFGNLVTPADWKYLWLNESFATYFGYGVVAHQYPEWHIWDQFLISETATALERDGLQETFAIEMPGGEKVAINSSTAPIIYNKGASVLRMIEGFIGTDGYQQGVRRYLAQHQYGCAQSHHLWEAFETATRQPITEMMQNWIGQPGHPLITADHNEGRLELHQKRFTYLDQPTDQTWMVPIKLTFWDAHGQCTERSEMMITETLKVDLPQDTVAYKLNSRQTGFYRVAYKNHDNLAALGRMIPAKSLGTVDRWGLENDQYALLRQGGSTLNDYLGFLKHYDDELDFLPVASMAGHLMQAYLIAAPDQRPAIAETGAALTRRVLEHIGRLPEEAEAQTTTILRDKLIWAAVIWHEEKTAGFAREQFQRMMAGEGVPADISKAVMQAGAHSQGKTAMDWLCKKFDQSQSEHERINIITALGAFDSRELIDRALSFTLENVPARNNFIPVAAAAVNPTTQAYLWDWYLDHLPDLEGFHPLLYERVITALWPYGGLDKTDTVLSFGKDYIQKHPELTDAVNLAMENLQINSRMRQALSD